MGKLDRQEEFSAKAAYDLAAFAEELFAKEYLKEIPAAIGRGQEESRRPTLRELWSATDVSPHEFTEKVAQFFGLRRVSLPELLASRSFVERFSPRFLRDSAIFPFDAANGVAALAMGARHFVVELQVEIRPVVGAGDEDQDEKDRDEQGDRGDEQYFRHNGLSCKLLE